MSGVSPPSDFLDQLGAGVDTVAGHKQECCHIPSSFPVTRPDTWLAKVRELLIEFHITWKFYYWPDSVLT